MTDTGQAYYDHEAMAGMIDGLRSAVDELNARFDWLRRNTHLTVAEALVAIQAGAGLGHD